MPVHCTAIGKVLLAYGDADTRRAVLTGPLERRIPHTVVARGMLRKQLDAPLETGIAFEREESTVGLTCVAAPVLGPDEQPVAAISLAGPTSHFRPEAQVDAIRGAAASVASTLARRRRAPTRTRRAAQS